MSKGEIVLYRTPDGLTEIQLRAIDGTVWLTQAQIAELFQVSPQNVTIHIRNILAEGELSEEATCKQDLQVRTEGGRAVRRDVKLYSLDIILAIGFRARSVRGTQFRQWATTALKDYLVKGFVMNDERLKDPGFDYFDELLARIRDIRASEARFYQKVRDILALSVDYDAKGNAAHTFYATIQNKMLFSVTGQTAAEIIAARSNPGLANMGLTTWKGSRVRKGDVTTAKNYLDEQEVSQLNLIVETFLNTAELRASRRQTMHLADWEQVLDTFLKSNDLPILRGLGSISAEQAQAIAQTRYDAFEEARRQAERATAAATTDVDELKRIADTATTSAKGRKRKLPGGD